MRLVSYLFQNTVHHRRLCHMAKIETYKAQLYA